ncbi:MAG: CHAT domain-containing protein [Caldilineaceae bacterium]
MPSLATLSILRLPDAYLFQFQPPNTRQPATCLAAVQPLPPGPSALSQQIEETIRLLNRLIVQRQPRAMAKGSPQPASNPEPDLLQSLGRLLYNQLLPPVIQQALHALPDGAPLLLMTNHAELPWELLHDGEQFLAMKHPVGRQMLVDAPPRRNAVHPRRLRTALLIGNPTGDLPQAEQEIEALLTLLETIPDMGVPVVLMQTRATKDALLKHLISGDYDWIHYSGHAFFDPAQPQASGLVLARDTHLTVAEIKQNLAGQPVVFLNGCESARGAAQRATPQTENDLAYLGLGLEGLAAAFLQGGAQSVVGAFWPIADAGSQTFALAFHRAALQGETSGAALQQARNALVDPTDPLWASYVLYGDPELKLAPALQAKAQPATVLVVRLQGLPALFASHRPEAAAQQIEAYLLGLTQTIQRCGGQVQSTAYHTLLALFGIPQTQEDDAERAVHAALEILAAGRPMPAASDRPALTCSIGLGSGDVFVNPLWVAGAALPVVTGQAVESATHLAEQGAPGEIVIAESTRRLTHNRFQLSPSVGQSAAGLGCYRVLGYLPEPEPFWRLPGHQTALIGRQPELALLKEAWQRSRQGQGQIVDVVGAAGIGKSRLLREFYNTLGQAAHWLVMSCPSAYAAGANWLIGQFVRTLLEMTAGEDSTALRRRLQQTLGRTSPESLAVIMEVLEATSPAATVRLLDQQADQHQLTNALVQWLLQKATETPLVLVLEDLHHADEASMTLLRQVIARLDQAPILVITLFRVEGDWQSPWRQRRNHRLAHLNGLDASESRALLATLLETPDVTEELAQTILAPAEGNPFFIRELVLSLRTAQALRLEQDGWRLARTFQPHHIPDSVERLIRLRVQSVSEPAQRVLALLAVAGDSCEYTVLQQSMAGAPAEALLEESLDELVDKELICQRWEKGKQLYRFPHALLQSVVYESLRSEERRRYHRRLRQALEQVYQGRETEILDLLAHHAYRSVTVPGVLGSPASIASEVSHAELARALGYLEQSGAQANRRYAAHQAIAYYRQALFIGETLPSAFTSQQAAYAGMAKTYQDDFEQFTLDPAWDVVNVNGAITLSREQSHAGNQSVKLFATGGGQPDVHLKQVFGTPLKRMVSIWFYDPAPGQQAVSGHFTLKLADCVVAHVYADGNDSDFYYAMSGLTPPGRGGRTSIARTQGWHHFAVDPLRGEIRIDDILVFAFPADASYDRVDLSVTGPGLQLNEGYYFDDFAIAPANNSSFTPLTDDFAKPTFDPSWTVIAQHGTVALSTRQRHTGAQSVEFRAGTGGQRELHLIRDLPSPITGATSVWFYDSAPGQQTLYVRFQLFLAGTHVAAINTQDYDGDVYHAGAFNGGPTTVARTLGWHHFEIDAAGGLIRIDERAVMAFPGNLRFDSIDLAVTGPGWRPSATYYFADFEIIPAVLPPTISSFSPISGRPRTQIAIIGANLLATTAVTLNGAPAPFKVLSNTLIRVEVLLSAKTGRLQVITPGGTAVSASDFTVLADTTSVPDVIGWPQSQAEAAIRAAWLTIGERTYQSSATVPVGQILNQNPVANSVVNLGTAIHWVISLGPYSMNGSGGHATALQTLDEV